MERGLEFPDIRESLSNALWTRLCGHGFLVEAVKPFPSGEILTHFHRKKKKRNRFCMKPRFESESFRTQTNGLFVDSRSRLPRSKWLARVQEIFVSVKTFFLLFSCILLQKIFDCL